MKGVIYTATDPLTAPCKARFSEDKRPDLQFEYSFKSLKFHHPHLSVTLFTNYPSLLENKLGVDSIIECPNDYGYMPKALNLARSPYTKTLFLDTDTEILGKLDGLFDLLDDCNFAISKECWDNYLDVVWAPESVFNTGVFVFDSSSASKQFISLWEKGLNLRKQEYIRKESKGQDLRPNHPCDQGMLNDMMRCILGYNNRECAAFLLRCQNKGSLYPVVAPLKNEPHDLISDMKFSIFDNKIYNCRMAAVPYIKENNKASSVKILHYNKLYLHKRSNAGAILNLPFYD